MLFALRFTTNHTPLKDWCLFKIVHQIRHETLLPYVHRGQIEHTLPRVSGMWSSTQSQFRQAPGQSVNNDFPTNLSSSQSASHHHVVVCAIQFIRCNFGLVNGPNQPYQNKQTEVFLLWRCLEPPPCKLLHLIR